MISDVSHSLGPWAWVVLVAEVSPCHTPRSASKAVLDELMLTCSEQCLQAVKLLQVRALHRKIRLIRSLAPSTPNPALYCPLCPTDGGALWTPQVPHSSSEPLTQVRINPSFLLPLCLRPLHALRPTLVAPTLVAQRSTRNAWRLRSVRARRTMLSWRS